MSQPPYHLRTNKAADRFAFIEAMRRLERLAGPLAEYTYYGLGGAYLEDIRLVYEFYPEISMVSIEENGEICSRQEFHRPCADDRLQLENNTLKSFIATYEAKDEKSIFWLDYTRLDYTCFRDFITLLGKIAVGSLVKITLRAHPADYWTWEGERPLERKGKPEQFRRRFAAVLPDQSAYPHWSAKGFAELLQRMLQIAAQQALPAEATPFAFQPVSSFYYSDSTSMFTLTGVLWPRGDAAAVEKAFNGWQFANLTWTSPKLIDIPDLSTKERLHLQRYLPCSTPPGATLRAKLGHLIEEDIAKSEAALDQYAAFHRYFPYFLRGTP